jgi:hypothetical protein
MQEEDFDIVLPCCCKFLSKIIETVVLTGIEPGKGG